MKRINFLIALALLTAGPMFMACAGTAAEAQQKANDTVKMETTTSTANSDTVAGPVVEIMTTLGDITVKLYDDTPLHRDNFLKLVKDGFYEGVLFHRVINNFMVQTGDPDSKTAVPGQRLGAGNPGYTIEAEILYPKHSHKYGALAAARTGDFVNPERRSSGSQFYIVSNRRGTPHLDGQYTVFGEVISGMDVVEKIQNVATDQSDRPVEDVKILSVKLLEE